MKFSNNDLLHLGDCLDHSFESATNADVTNNKKQQMHQHLNYTPEPAYLIAHKIQEANPK